MSKRSCIKRQTCVPSGGMTTNDNDWQWVVQRVKTNDNEWKEMKSGTKSDNKWQLVEQ